MNQLKISIERVPYPYEDIEKPSRIRINVQTDHSAIEVLNWRWDAAAVTAWLAENARAISEERLPAVLVGGGRSIAESIKKTRYLLDPNDDAEHEAIYDYATRHCLVLAFSGTPIPAIYLGIGRDGGEISCFDRGNRWRYDVDLSGFPDDLEALLVEIADTWVDPEPRA